MDKVPHFNCREYKFNPGSWETEIPHAANMGEKIGWKEEEELGIDNMYIMQAASRDYDIVGKKLVESVVWMLGTEIMVSVTALKQR